MDPNIMKGMYEKVALLIQNVITTPVNAHAKVQCHDLGFLAAR